jgi:starch synthase (maltosyl-transferring)
MTLPRSITPPLPHHAPPRIVIDKVSPEVDGGRFAAKRVVGQVLVVDADILIDGHDELDCRLRVRPGTTGPWREVPLTCVGNDCWRATVPLDRIGHWEFDVVARVDEYRTWLRDLARRS